MHGFLVKTARKSVGKYMRGGEFYNNWRKKSIWLDHNAQWESWRKMWKKYKETETKKLHRAWLPLRFMTTSLWLNAQCGMLLEKWIFWITIILKSWTDSNGLVNHFSSQFSSWSKKKWPTHCAQMHESQLNSARGATIFNFWSSPDKFTKYFQRRLQDKCYSWLRDEA